MAIDACVKSRIFPCRECGKVIKPGTLVLFFTHKFSWQFYFHWAGYKPSPLGGIALAQCPFKESALAL
jgi:hypothetical protein